MRLNLDPRAQRLLGRVPRANVYTVAELALLSLLALQCARLVWTVATPLGPVGDWKPAAAAAPAAAAGIFGGFDPFFRLSGAAGPVVVTALDLKLFGVRQDQVSGRGSAIIATPDGQQKSYGVGEEIMPGVTLAGVEFDSVTITRGGNIEQLFMDQSRAAQVTGPATATERAAPVAVVTAPPVDYVPGKLAGQLALEPRMNGDRVTGVVLRPEGAGDAFRAAGLQPGDVLIGVNGQRITSVDQLSGLREQLAGPRGATVQVERGGRMMRLQLRTGR